MNELIDRSVFFQPPTAIHAAAQGRCIGVEAHPVAQGLSKRQKIVSIAAPCRDVPSRNYDA